MNTLQKTALLHSDLKVNAGKPKPSETPMWKGKTSFKVNGKQLVAAVSADRTWWRVRFEGMDTQLPPELHAQMSNASFFWGKKEGNLCYFGDSNDAKVRMLRELGYSAAQHITTPIIREVVKVKGNVEHPAQVEAKGKTTPTVKANGNGASYTPTVKVNAVGRTIDARTGQFIGEDKSMNGNGHAVPSATATLGYDSDEMEAAAYEAGFHTGRYHRDNGIDLSPVWMRGYEDGLKPDPVVEADHSQEIAAITEAVSALATGMAAIQAALAKLVK